MKLISPCVLAYQEKTPLFGADVGARGVTVLSPAV